MQYLPGESNTGMFGGNSNWRGPVWMPVNTLIIRALVSLYEFYGDDFQVQCPTGSGRYMTLFDVAQEISADCPVLSCVTPMDDGRSTEGRPSSRKIRIGAI